MDTTPVLPAYLTVTEVARMLRLSRSTTYALVRRGQLPAIRVGDSIRVPVAALEEYLASVAAEGVMPD
jgi:excisionase family DNA binding protein